MSKTFPTTKQREATKLVLNGTSVSRAMREAGYDETTAKNPKNLTESKGFKELCDELGLTENLIVDALVEDIKTNKGKRVPELTLASKILGLEKTPEGTQTNYIAILLKQYGLGGIENENTESKAD